MILPLNYLRAYDNGEYDFRLLGDDAANNAALSFLNHNIFNAYAMLFYDELNACFMFHPDMSVKKFAVTHGIIPSGYSGSEDNVIELLRSAADVIASPDYLFPSFMEQRVIYGLIEYLKESFYAENDQLSPEETVSDIIKDPIKKGLREHPEDWGYECDTLEESFVNVLNLIIDPNNYEDIFFDDYDFLFMDEWAVDEDALARMPIADFANMRAMTNEERAEEDSLSKSIDRRYAERKIVDCWLQEEQKKRIFSFAPYDKDLRKRELQRRVKLTPTTHIVNMLKDIKDGNVDLFRWVNSI